MSRRPVIAVTTDVRVERRNLHFVFETYVSAVERAGGFPVHFPSLDPAGAGRVLDLADGVIIVGGEDLDPALYGEDPLPTHDPVPPDRERFDRALADALLGSNHPVLGICYGAQLLTVASGGSLWQDIPTQIPGSLRHGGGQVPALPHHEIEVQEGTRLREILGSGRIEVNSAHHQAPRKLAGGFVRSAAAPDGVTEGIERPGDRFLVAVEWHPELMPDRPEQRRLFEALVEAAGRD